MSDYREEFRSYDDTLPEPPTGFVDASWHNDVCPSFDHALDGGAYLRLWCDYKARELRELGPNDSRFSFAFYDDESQRAETLWHGEEYPTADTVADALRRAREMSV